jgi:negative regulator of sigma E activity
LLFETDISAQMNLQIEKEKGILSSQLVFRAKNVSSVWKKVASMWKKVSSMWNFINKL